METPQLPQWLIIVGQSGSGKGTAAKIVHDWYTKYSLSVLELSTGDLIRDCIQQKTYLTEQMERINDACLRQPAIVAASLWLTHLFKNLKPDQYILHEGSPRSVEEFEMMLSLTKIRYVSSMKIIEIVSSDESCRKRLYERTKQDKRKDLSLEGEIGVPDLDKIDIKLRWWTNNRDEIIRAAKRAGVYIQIENVGTLQDLENKLIAQFGFL